MKRKPDFRRGLLCFAMALLIAGMTHPQTAKAEIVNMDELPGVSVDGEYNFWKDIVIDESGVPVNLSPGVMPSVGNPKIAVIMVDFPDTKGNAAVTKSLVEELFFGESGVRNYYAHASYGALNISGDVYGWYTAENDRSYYASEANIHTLANEVLEALEDEIDFTQYDSNNDGYIDGLYLCYAGAKGDWASQLWSYVSSAALKVDGKYLDRFAFINENHIYGYDELNNQTWTSMYTIAHETGHMLGLKDYYDTEYGYSAIYSGSTLMDDSVGELDAFSKYLLGWIEPVVITENDTATLKPSFTNASAVIIYPDEAIRNEAFLLVEYIPEGFSMGYYYKEGIRVYKVNAESEDGYLCHTNSVKRDNVDLIDIFSDFNTEPGPILYADQAPSSYFIKEDEAGDAILEYTGVAIDLVSYTEEAAEISVSFVAEDEVEITHTESVLLNNNKLYVELAFSLENLPTENANAYVLMGNERKNLQISRYDDKFIVAGWLNNDEKGKYVLYSKEFELEPGMTYTVVVEADSFLDPLGNTNEEFSFEVTTEDFMGVTVFDDEYLLNIVRAMPQEELKSFDKTDYMPIENNCMIRLYIYLNKLYAELFDENGNREVKLLYTAESNVELNRLYSVRMKNGNTILRIETSKGTRIFLVDKEWNCRLLFTTQEKLVTDKIDIVYNVAYLAVLDEQYYYTQGTKLYLISEDGEVTEKKLEVPFRYQTKAYEIPGEKILFVTNDYLHFSVFDKEFNLIKKVLDSDDSKAEQEAVGLIYASERIRGVTVKDNKNVLITYTDGDYQWYELYLDKNYKVVQRNRLPFTGSGSFANLGDAYLFCQGYDIAEEVEYPTFLGFGVTYIWFNPVDKVTITDTEYNEKYSYSIDGSVDSIKLTDDGCLFVTSDYEVVITEEVFTGYTVPELPESMEPTDPIEAFVTRMYRVILEREPDAGSSTWMNGLKDGSMTGVRVADGFVLSEEMLNKDISNEEFVKILYRAFFGREADEGGLATWKGLLDEGCKKQYVFAGFANSTEFGNLCAEAGIVQGRAAEYLADRQTGLSDADYKVWCFVERMYTEVLGRTADEAGVRTWVGVLQDGSYTGVEVADGFLMSEEFLGKSMTDEAYVQIMYRAFFGRNADSEGLATWTNALATGWTKQRVFAGFANSNEFGVLCEQAGIVKGTATEQ